MKRIAFGLAGVAVAGGVALLHGTASPASAEITTFHAITVAATQNGDFGFAWIIGQDGSARFCTGAKSIPQQGPSCVPVRY